MCSHLASILSWGLLCGRSMTQTSSQWTWRNHGLFLRLFKQTSGFCFKPDTRSSGICSPSSSTPRWWCQLPAPPGSPVVSPEALPWCSQYHRHGPEWIPRTFYVSNPPLISPYSELQNELHSPPFGTLKKDRETVTPGFPQGGGRLTRSCYLAVLTQLRHPTALLHCVPWSTHSQTKMIGEYFDSF